MPVKKKPNYAKRFVKDSSISKNKKNLYRTPEQRSEDIETHNDLLKRGGMPPGNQYEPIENREFKILLYEIDKVKLYLFDFIQRFEDIKEQIIQIKLILDKIQNPGAYANPGPLPEFNRSAMYKGPNANKGQDFVRRNVAQILKNMMPRATLDMMPKEVREAYHNILSVMGAPNDPIWEKEHPPDPREPNDTFKSVADLWNNVAINMKKLEGVNLAEEIAKAADETSVEEQPSAADQSINPKEEEDKK